MNGPRYPFSAVVGHDEVKLALLLSAVDPRIGGVLLRGEKGSAKSTLTRGLAGLLGPDAPFVELPVGATEDRVVGSIDLRTALTAGEERFRPGLLQAADGGVLYVDEVNLLPDHLVDVLLDVAASGVNRVEREGISHAHPSRFVLVGSMNPEEGDLRPQLLDRFGLAVDVASSPDPSERAEAVGRRLAFDADPDGYAGGWEQAEDELRRRLQRARPASLTDELVRSVSALCVDAGAEGLRADLVICRAAAAVAGWEGRSETTVADVRRIAGLALAHRRRRSPLEQAGMSGGELDDLLDRNLGPGGAGGADGAGGDGAGTDGSGQDAQAPGGPGSGPDSALDSAPDSVAPTGTPRQVVGLETPPRPGPSAVGRRSTGEVGRGRVVGSRPASAGGPAGVAVRPTALAAARRRGMDATAGGPGEGPRNRSGSLVDDADLMEPVRRGRTATLVVLAVDASSSMGVEDRMEVAKSTVLSLLLDAYQRRDTVSLVTFRGDAATVALRPTGSVEVARARLAELPTGGATPLAEGLEAALGIARQATRTERTPLLIVVSDGRATSGPEGADPFEAALDVAASIRRAGVSALVIDTEVGRPRLGLARRLAEVMGAPCLAPADLDAAVLTSHVDELRRTTSN
ncbi:MAG TPA: AAA family ATPase [Acidimicrobiales bacterium]|nr:AAA family ATPase [Acidimicrobiales bacterium]